MEIIRNFEQQSEEWFKATMCSIGGSGIKKVTAKGKKITRTKHKYKLAYQKATGRLIPTYQDYDMQLGNDVEPYSLKCYSIMTGIDIEQVALVRDTEYKHYSPDSLTLCGNGIVESKNINEVGFIDTLDKERMPPGHNKQIQWGLKICQREWCDFIQSHFIRDEDGMIVPGIKSKPIWTTRIYRDEDLIKELDLEADKFIDELLKLVEKIKKSERSF